MAATITLDLVDGHNFTEDDKSGELSRYAFVNGLDSTSRITTDALYAVDGAKIIPRAGQVHERLPDLVVRRVEVVGRAKTQCKIKIVYVKVRRRLLDISLNGVSQQIETAFDKDGKIIVNGYQGELTGGAKTDPATPFPDPKANNKKYRYEYGGATGYIPDIVFEVTYLEKENPWPKIKKYTRKVNVKPWNGGEAREWFCEAITAKVESPIATNMAALGNPEVITGVASFDWIVTYRFRYSEKPKPGGQLSSPGHDPVLIFKGRDIPEGIADIDPLAGGWPINKKGNGWLVPEVLQAEDFGDLKLVTPFGA